MSTTDTTTLTAEELEYANEIGTLVFQGALVEYLESADETTLHFFQQFIEENVNNTSFMDDLCVAYPDFKEALEAEMADFTEDAHALRL